MKKFQVKVNGRYEFELAEKGDNLLLNNEPLNLDIMKINDREFHVIHDHQSYNVEVLDRKEKQFSIRINGHEYEVQVNDRYDLLLQKLGMTSAASAKVDEIKAPMPGKVVSILVKPGDEVQKDDQVLVLEAMKMENAIKSPGEGKVKAVKVKEGQPVEKNQVLVVFE